MNQTDNPNTQPQGYAIAVFAHNEENNICETLASIIANTDENLHGIYILANGCTDDTATVANDFFKENNFSKYKIVEISLGDKCNAWNEYVYNYRPQVDHHFFVDSDVTFSTDAFKKLNFRFSSNTHHVMAGLPLSGRNKKKYLQLAIEYGCFFGNLYCMKSEFLDRLKSENIRLPMGLFWIDAQLTKLVNEDLRGTRDDYRPRVTCVEGVGYKFKSLKPWRLADIKLWINRIARYKAGQLQEPYLDAIKFSEWPRNMNKINQSILDEINNGNIKLPKILRPNIIRKLRKKL